MRIVFKRLIYKLNRMPASWVGLLFSFFASLTVLSDYLLGWTGSPDKSREEWIVASVSFVMLSYMAGYLYGFILPRRGGD